MPCSMAVNAEWASERAKNDDDDDGEETARGGHLNA